MNDYIIRNGDIIRVFEDDAIDGQIYFITEESDDGKYIAHPFNGPALIHHPLDTIEYIKVNGRWWEVVSTNCSQETIDKFKNVTYDIVEVLPCTACVLEKEYKELLV